MRRYCGMKTFSFVLIMALLSSSLYGCAKTGEGGVSLDFSGKTEQPDIEIDANEIVEQTVETILEKIENEDGNKPEEVDDVIEIASTLQETENWEKYIGDFETFTYGLIVNKISYCYDVFPAYVRLSNGTEVSGIAYTDYSECYADEERDEVVILTGFISSAGETGIPDSEFDKGLELFNSDYQDEEASFVYAYRSDEFIDHCVVYGDYLKYGVNDEGEIFFENEEYSKDVVDESIGSLYSYDEKKYLLDLDLGNYVGIVGKSLSSQIDYDELEKEINRVLEEQDYNFSDVDIESCCYFAQEAVTSFLLSMQEETFLGYDVDELIELASQLDPLECYRLTDEGMLTFNIEELEKPSSLCKWIVGSACVVSAIVGVVASCVFIECPVLSAVAGEVSGIAVEVFIQVVLENKKLGSVNWLKVALSAATSAVSGYMGPYVFAQYGRNFAQYFVVDSFIDGALGGTERAIISLIDGGDLTEVAKQFGWGFALGAGLSAGFKATGKGLEKLSSHSLKAIKKIAPKLCAKTSDVTGGISTSLGGKLSQLKKMADSTVFHSEYISRKISSKTLEKLVNEGSDELANKAFDAIKKTDILDIDENKISKKALRELFDKADDGDIIGHFKLDGEIVDIVKQNGAVGVRFDSSKYQTVTLSKGLVADRDINYEEAVILLKKSWLEGSFQMPESISKALSESGLTLENIEAKKLVDIIQKSDFVLHENLDLMTITLVARKVHDKSLDGVAHMGGYALAKYIKEKMGMDYFDRFIATAASAAA